MREQQPLIEDPLEAIKLLNKGHSFRNIKFDLHRNNEQVVLTAINKSWQFLDYVSETMRDSHKIVRRAIDRMPDALQFASDRLKDDRDFILSLATTRDANVQWGLCILEHASDRLKDDFGLVNELAGVRGYGIQHASKRLQNQRPLALKAVSTECLALQYLPHYQDDEEFVRIAVESGVGTIRVGFEYASTRLKADRGFVLEMCKLDPRSIEHASEALKSLCQGNDPVKAIEAQIFAEQLQDSLKRNNEVKKSTKFKI